MLTRNAIGNLVNRYRAVLKKCRLLNVFGSLAVAGMLVMGGAEGVQGQVLTGSLEKSMILSDTPVELSGAVFNGITSPSDGVLHVKDCTLITDGKESTFANNTSSGYGGALYIGITSGKGTDIISKISNTIFTSNTVNKNDDDSSYGGAITLRNRDKNSTLDITIEDSKFSHNEQTGGQWNGSNTEFSGGGGAIWVNMYSKLTVINSIFEGNKSEYGGAIRTDGKSLVIENSEFYDNSSTHAGGAISSALSIEGISISGSTFKNNTSDDPNGAGAVYIGSNTKGLTLSGENLFENNRRNDTLNDIRSNHSVTVTDGTTELLSGYVQDESSNSIGSLTVNDTAKLAVDGEGMTLNAGTVTVNKGGALAHGTDIAGLNEALTAAAAEGVDTSGGAFIAKKSLDLSSASLGVGQSASGQNGVVGVASGSALLVDQEALNGDAAFTNVHTAEMADGSTLHVQNAKAGESLTVFSSDGGTTPTGITDGTPTVSTDNSMVTVDPASIASGTLKTTVGDVGAALPGLSSELGALVTGLYAAGQNDANAPQRGRAFISRLTHKDYMLADPKGAVRTLESAARIAAVGAVPQMTMAAVSAGASAVTQRTSIAAPESAGLQAVAADGTVQTGASAGDAAKNGFAMWIMPLYQSWNAWGMEGGGLDMDVNGGLGGLALGADYTFDNAFRAGITVNMGGGYAEGSGDFSKTTNDFTFWGLGAYLGWSKDNFGLTADINHTWVYNELEQELASSMKMDALKSDITSRALSAGLRGEYKIATEALDITPHLGVRYTHLTTDKYDVESGGTVMEGDAIHQGIWTFPIGVAFSKDVQTENGWYVKPSLDLAVIPAAGDIKARGDVRFTGVNGSAEVSTQTMDYISYMGQAGLEFGNDNVKLGVNYNLQMGAQSTAHGVFGTLRYEF